MKIHRRGTEKREGLKSVGLKPEGLKIGVLGGLLLAGLVSCGSMGTPGGAPTAADIPAAEGGSGLLQGQVVGGFNASPNQFPFIVSLGHCTGSVINSEWILTARHCTAGRTPGSLTLVAGEHRRSVTEGPEQSRTGVSKMEHPSRDLALVKLSSPLVFGSAVNRIEVGALPAVGTTFTAAGWGATNPDGTGSTDIPKFHSPQLAADSVCGSFAGLEFCGQDTTGLNWQVCFGDSGGPAFFGSGSARRLIGAVQRASRTGTGSACSRGLAIYAALDLAWIRANAGAAFTATDPAEGSSPDFKRLEVTHDAGNVTVDIEFYNAADLANAGHNVYLYGTFRDTINFSRTSFSVRRDLGADGHFETLLTSGTVTTLGDRTLRLRFARSVMSDVTTKQVWVYSQTSRDRLPNTGVLQLN